MRASNAFGIFRCLSQPLMLKRIYRNPVRVAVLLGVAGVVAGVTAYLYLQMVKYENNVADSAFKGRFESYGPEFVAYWTGLLRGLRAVADGLSSHGTLPSSATFVRVCTSLFWSGAMVWPHRLCLALNPCF